MEVSFGGLVGWYWGAITNINPVVRGPSAVGEEKGIRSVWWMEKGVVRHCGQRGIDGGRRFAFARRYEAVVLVAISVMRPVVRPRMDGTVRDNVVTWFRAEAKYSVTADDGS